MGNKVKKKAPEKKPVVKGKPEPVKKQEVSDDIRGIIRIAGYDMIGQMPVKRALTRIQGIGINLAKYVAKLLQENARIDPDMPVGKLDENQVAGVEKVLFAIQDYSVPKHMLNNRRDCETGKDSHVIGNDLIFKIRQVIEGEKKQYSWKGFRFLHGQKVRGQRTRTTGRSGMSMGVLRKTMLAKTGQAAGAAQATAQQGPAKSAGPSKPSTGPSKPAAGPAKK